MMNFSVIGRFLSADPLHGSQGTGSTKSEPHPYIFAATATALSICSILAATSFYIPPALYSDPGLGFLAWRGTLLGHLNCFLLPDPADIAADSATFFTAQSPGQYLFPGVIALSGLPLGAAITLTSTLCLFLSLIGWIKVFHQLVSPSKTVIFAVAVIGLFRYSTLPFGIYDGGEILLQAITPWIILGTLRVPYLSAMKAALLSGSLVFLAFMMKLTGLIVVGSGLIAGGIVALRRLRRIEPGMVGGAVAAVSMLGAIYQFFLSRGWTPLTGDWVEAQGSSWSFPWDSVMLSVVAPWVSGLAWTDLLAWIFLHPGRELIPNGAIIVCLMLPAALIVVALVALWEPKTEKEWDLRIFVFWFYGVTAAIFVYMYIQGADLGHEGRHFRSAGTLLVVGALIGATGAKPPNWIRHTFFALLTFMAFYGLASFSSRASAMADGHALDRISWTNQPIVDASAIRYLQETYSFEKRHALFVIPSPDIVVTLPLEARVVAVHIDFQSEAEIAALKYRGRVPGHIFILMQNRIADSSKGQALLRAFVDYDPRNWRREKFSSSSVFVQ